MYFNAKYIVLSISLLLIQLIPELHMPMYQVHVVLWIRRTMLDPLAITFVFQKTEEYSDACGTSQTTGGALYHLNLQGPPASRRKS